MRDLGREAKFLDGTRTECRVKNAILHVRSNLNCEIPMGVADVRMTGSKECTSLLHQNGQITFRLSVLSRALRSGQLLNYVEF